MKTLNVCLALLLTAIGSTGLATNYYVAATGSTPTEPWTNWGSAHTNLIEVVARCRDNDTVYVTNNSTYYLTNHVVVGNTMTVRSWRADGELDPTTTIIDGNYPNTTNRCFYITNYNACVAGFTITNGCVPTANGGGVNLLRGHLTNCVITGNRCYRTTDLNKDGGGGLYLGDVNHGGSGTVWNCTISGNTCSNYGGGVKVSYGGPWIIANSTIAENIATNLSVWEAGGGGLSAYNTTGGLELRDCLIVSNVAKRMGGGVAFAVNGQLTRCIVVGNISIGSKGGGGGVYLSTGGRVRNCLIYNNNSWSVAGGGVYFDGSDDLVQNCTIYSNVASSGGGLGFNGIGFVENSIIWANSGSGSTSNYWTNTTATAWFTNCCVAPGPGAYGTNCYVGDPQFVNILTNNCRVKATSPCINAGFNRVWMDGAKELDDRSRIDHFSGIVDMGAYEYLLSGTLFTIR